MPRRVLYSDHGNQVRDSDPKEMLVAKALESENSIRLPQPGYAENLTTRTTNLIGNSWESDTKLDTAWHIGIYRYALNLKIRCHNCPPSDAVNESKYVSKCDPQTVS
jgi:hypothetical protein